MAARPIDPFGAEYAYTQVADDVQRRINEGDIPVKLPSERSFAEEYGVPTPPCGAPWRYFASAESSSRFTAGERS